MVVTSTLPLAVYVFTKQVTGSRDVASLSSLLVAASDLVTAVGTHTLVNSFVSPFIFFTMTEVVTLIQHVHSQPPESPTFLFTVRTFVRDILQQCMNRVPVKSRPLCERLDVIIANLKQTVRKDNDDDVLEPHSGSAVNDTGQLYRYINGNCINLQTEINCKADGRAHRDSCSGNVQVLVLMKIYLFVSFNIFSTRGVLKVRSLKTIAIAT